MDGIFIILIFWSECLLTNRFKKYLLPSNGFSKLQRLFRTQVKFLRTPRKTGKAFVWGEILKKEEEKTISCQIDPGPQTLSCSHTSLHGKSLIRHKWISNSCVEKHHPASAQSYKNLEVREDGEDVIASILLSIHFLNHLSILGSRVLEPKSVHQERQAENTPHRAEGTTLSRLLETVSTSCQLWITTCLARTKCMPTCPPYSSCNILEYVIAARLLLLLFLAPKNDKRLIQIITETQMLQTKPRETNTK